MVWLLKVVSVSLLLAKRYKVPGGAAVKLALNPKVQVGALSVCWAFRRADLHACTNAAPGLRLSAQELHDWPTPQGEDRL